MIRPVLLFSLLLARSLLADQDVTTRAVTFNLDGKAFESILIRPDHPDPAPGVFMVPNWNGPNENTKAKAERIARMGYVVYLADMYSAGIRPANAREAGATAGQLRGDRKLMRKRALTAFRHFQSLAPENGVAENQFAAIGFCFGGGVILELARTGEPLKAFVAFHSDLKSPTLDTDSNRISGKVLILHGADDPYVPEEEVSAFQSAMRATNVDWQFVTFSGAVHSFTDPTAAAAGQAEYNEAVSRRAFIQMNLFFDEVFKK